jgi:hypothetical protein
MYNLFLYDYDGCYPISATCVTISNPDSVTRSETFFFFPAVNQENGSVAKIPLQKSVKQRQTIIFLMTSSWQTLDALGDRVVDSTSSNRGFAPHERDKILPASKANVTTCFLWDMLVQIISERLSIYTFKEFSKGSSSC